jgi:hypothetical protein
MDHVEQNSPESTIAHPGRTPGRTLFYTYASRVSGLWLSVRESVIRVLMWSVFVGLLGSIPLLVAFIDGTLRGHPPTAYELIGQGELLLICCAVSADSMSRVLNNIRRHAGSLDFLRCFLLICSFTTILLCTILYTDFRYAIASKELDVPMLVVWSKRIAKATFVVGVWTTLFAND